MVKFQRGELNISIQRWIITQCEMRLSEEESKFIRLFGKGFKLIKTSVMTRMGIKLNNALSFGLFTFFPVKGVIPKCSQALTLK